MLAATKLTAAVAHHPARDHLLDALLSALDRPVEVVTDPEPDRGNAWLNAKEAWLLGLGLGGTHHLVMENDIVPCLDVLAAIERACATRPGDLLRFYTPDLPGLRRPTTDAISTGSAWAPYEGWGCAQAVVMPVGWIEPFVEYGECHPEHTGFPDGRMREWLRQRVKRPAWTSVPSLVDHLPGPSLAGSPAHHAIWFIGADVSGLTIDWSRGA